MKRSDPYTCSLFLSYTYLLESSSLLMIICMLYINIILHFLLIIIFGGRVSSYGSIVCNLYKKKFQFFVASTSFFLLCFRVRPTYQCRYLCVFGAYARPINLHFRQDKKEKRLLLTYIYNLFIGKA